MPVIRCWQICGRASGIDGGNRSAMPAVGSYPGLAAAKPSRPPTARNLLADSLHRLSSITAGEVSGGAVSGRTASSGGGVGVKRHFGSDLRRAADLKGFGRCPGGAAGRRSACRWPPG